MMSSGSTVIRYIDICLNLLFGFICFSELSRQDKIELATTVELKPAPPDAEMVVFVGVQSNGVYLLDGEKIRTPDPDIVERYLLARKDELAQKKYKMRVRVRANYDTPVRFVMRAVDLCDRIDVARGVDVRIGKKVKM
jgi:biopolymer transport protein ExbD